MQMRRKILTMLLSAVLVVSVGLGLVFLKNNERVKADTAPTLTIEKKNLSYADSVYILYAVSGEGVDFAKNEVKMMFWTDGQENGSATHFTVKTTSGSASVNGKDCLVFYSDGIAAKEMTDVVYAKAFVNIGSTTYYSETVKYSVLDYVYDMREKGGLSEAQENAFDALLTYGASMQILFDYQTNKLATAEFFKVSAINGVFQDGFATGRYVAGEKVTVTANLAPEGQNFVCWLDENGDFVSGDEVFEITVSESQTYTALYEKYGLFYTFNKAGTKATVSVWLGSDTAVVIPANYLGVPVTAIEESAFNNCPDLVSVTIPSSVISIGADAFANCPSLTIYCEAESKPSGYDIGWNSSACPVYWYSVNEPAVNEDGTAYDGNFWRYVNGKINVWDEEEFANRVTQKEELEMYFPSFQSKVSGDCTLIKLGDTEVLIDAGSKRNSASIIVPYIAQYCTDGILEYVIATHAHEDHIAAFVGTTASSTDGVLEAFKIGTIIDYTRKNTTSAVSKEYESVRDGLVQTGTKHYTALECWNEQNGAQRSYSLGEGVSLNILYQKYYESSSSTENNYSVCTMISYENKNFLFTGDLQSEGEASLLASNDLPVCELFKSGHHGSNTSNTSALLAKIQPKTMIVTCCCGDQYDFPHQETIDTVSLYTDKVYAPTIVSGDGWELLNGNITVVYDGKNLKVTGSNHSLLLKETTWFKNNRTMPTAWK